MTNRPTATLDTSSVEGTLSGFFLSGIDWLDQTYGAQDWNTRHVAIGTAILLGLSRYTLQHKIGINWASLLHASTTGFLSFVCVWLNIFSASSLTGTAEPLRSVLCQGSLTSLHRIIPAITAGFGVLDVIEGFYHGVDFFMHGLVTISVMTYFCEYDVGEIITPMLLMELSTVPLGLASCTLMSDTVAAVNLAAFVLTFFIIRVFLGPYLWWEILRTTWEQQANPESQVCLPWHFKYVVFVVGMFFNCLNSFWAYKIVRKVARKLNGTEKIKHKNGLGHAKEY